MDNPGFYLMITICSVVLLIPGELSIFLRLIYCGSGYQNLLEFLVEGLVTFLSRWIAVFLLTEEYSHYHCMKLLSSGQPLPWPLSKLIFPSVSIALPIGLYLSILIQVYYVRRTLMNALVDRVVTEEDVSMLSTLSSVSALLVCWEQLYLHSHINNYISLNTATKANNLSRSSLDIQLPFLSLTEHFKYLIPSLFHRFYWFSVPG